jgi:hypothetical protein
MALYACVCSLLNIQVQIAHEMGVQKKLRRKAKHRLKLVVCLHPVACTRSGSGFPSKATLV